MSDDTPATKRPRVRAPIGEVRLPDGWRLAIKASRSLRTSSALRRNIATMGSKSRLVTAFS